MPTPSGRETFRFTLATNSADLPIEFRDGTLTTARLNGQTLHTSLEDGHLVLPARLLHADENKFDTTFTARIATAGAAITRYEDKDDNGEYFYSLFVPMDASMAFPCFDQPDLKAGFSLAITTPNTWTVIANTASSRIRSSDNTQVSEFPETKPISTYLFAFAAGHHPKPLRRDRYFDLGQGKAHHQRWYRRSQADCARDIHAAHSRRL